MQLAELSICQNKISNQNQTNMDSASEDSDYSSSFTKSKLDKSYANSPKADSGHGTNIVHKLFNREVSLIFSFMLQMLACFAVFLPIFGLYLTLLLFAIDAIKLSST